MSPYRTLLLACSVVATTAIALPPATGQEGSGLSPAAGGLVAIGPGNSVKKALVVRSGPDQDGASLHAVFDTDTLRVGAAWIADGANGVARSSDEGVAPTVNGTLLFENPDSPGWASASASPGEDTRYVASDGQRCGPLDADQGRWIGQYRAGDQAVWSYEVAGVSVLESPSSAAVDGVPVLVRQFEVGPRSQGLTLQVAYDRSVGADLSDSGGVIFPSPGRRGPAPGAPNDRRDEGDDDEDFDEDDFDEDDEEFYEDDEDEEEFDEDEDEFEDDFDEDAPLEFEGDTSLRVTDTDDFDLTGSDYTIVARVRTEEGGTIFAQAPGEGGYAPDSKSLFIADGVLQFDIGWVDVLRTETEIDDGEWHCVAVSFDSAAGEATLYVDGQAEATRGLSPNEAVDRDYALRVGFTSPDFPDDVRGFEGQIPSIAFYQRRLDAAALRKFADGEPPKASLIALWDRFDHDEDRLLDRVGKHHAEWEDIDIEDFDEEDFDDEDEFEDDEDFGSRPLEFDGESVRVRVDEITLDKVRGESYSLVARVRTESGGPLFSVTAKNGGWEPNNLCWFIREGRLVFDLGFVGQVEGEERIDDGEWHTVSMFYNSETGDVRFFVDGQEDDTNWIESDRVEGLFPIESDEDASESCAWIGFASDEFPERAPRYFGGRIAQLRVYEGVLDGEEAKHLLGLSPAETLGEIAAWRPLTFIDGAVDDQSDNGIDGIVLGVEGPTDSAYPFTECHVFGDLASADLQPVSDGRLTLRVPSGAEPLHFAVAYIPRADRADVLDLSGLKESLVGVERLSRLTAETAATAAPRLAGDIEPIETDLKGFVVEELRPPSDRPSDSQMQLSAVDFFPGEETAVAVTLDGEVWLIEGLAQPNAELASWRRIASGLAEPRGVCVVDGVIHVLGRGEITRLINAGGDASIDFYECVSNAALSSAHPGDAATGFTRSADGGFAYVRGGPRHTAITTPHQGAVLTVSETGESTSVVANGFSCPAGLCAADDGNWWVVDRDGLGVPKDRIAKVTSGDYFGAFGSAPAGSASDRIARARAWVHGDFLGGLGGVVRIDSPSWPELKGNLLVLPASGTDVAVALLGATPSDCTALYKLPIGQLPRGMESGVFNAEQDALYLCGHRDPSSGLAVEGRIVRITRDGAAPAIPIAVRSTSEGVEITFSGELDRASAEDWRNYSASQWTYRWTDQFGSQDYRLSDQRRRGRDRLLVDASSLSPDRRTVSVRLSGWRPAPSHALKCDLRADDGSPVAMRFLLTTDPLDARRSSPSRGI